MNKTKPARNFIFLAGFFFCAVTPAIAALDCTTLEQDQNTMNQCQRMSAETTDNELNALYQKKLKSLTDEANKTYLKNAQKAWLKFRDASCLYEEGPATICNSAGCMPNGSSWSWRVSLCEQAFAKKRIEELKTYLDCASNGCPI